MLLTGVAVEKLDISEIGANLGDRKCLAEQRKSLQNILTRCNFCEFLDRKFFNTHSR
jgi:hypothetical protein